MQTVEERARVQQTLAHYAESVDFLGLFEAGAFDEEVEHTRADGTRVWMGLNRSLQGLLEVRAEFVYDGDEDSGWGWWL